MPVIPFPGFGGGGPGPAGTTYGSMNYGAGPYGGVFPGADYDSPQVINISPAPNATGIHPRPTIQFDVIDYEGNLDPTSVRALVNGVAVFDSSQVQKFFEGWTGTTTVLPFGLRVNMTAPDFVGDGATVSMTVRARDTAGNTVKRSWSFTTAVAVTISAVTVIGNRCVLLAFSAPLRVNGELFRTSNYAFAVRIGYGKEVYTGTVTSPSEVPDALVSQVEACMKDYFSLNGRYSVRVQGPNDEFGRVIDTAGLFNAG